MPFYLFFWQRNEALGAAFQGIIDSHAALRQEVCIDGNYAAKVNWVTAAVQNIVMTITVFKNSYG